MRFLTAKNVVIRWRQGAWWEKGRWEVEYQGPSGAYKLISIMDGLKPDTPPDILRKMAKAILSGDFLGMPEKVSVIR